MERKSWSFSWKNENYYIMVQFSEEKWKKIKFKYQKLKVVRLFIFLSFRWESFLFCLYCVLFSGTCLFSEYSSIFLMVRNLNDCNYRFLKVKLVIAICSKYRLIFVLQLKISLISFFWSFMEKWRSLNFNDRDFWVTTGTTENLRKVTINLLKV